MAEQTELIKSLIEVGTVYHSLLFSYQRGLKQHMGSNSNLYIHPAISHLLEMDEQGGLKLDKSKTFEEAVSAFIGFLERSKMVKKCTLDKIDENSYTFKVEGCIWAGKVHTRQTSLNDVTCPYALLTMALYKKYKGFISKENESEYFYNGTETTLMASFILSQNPFLRRVLFSIDYRFCCVVFLRYFMDGCRCFARDAIVVLIS